MQILMSIWNEILRVKTDQFWWLVPEISERKKREKKGKCIVVCHGYDVLFHVAHCLMAYQNHNYHWLIYQHYINNLC